MNAALRRAATLIALLALAAAASAQQTFTIYWNNNHLYDTYQQVFDAFAEEHDLELQIETFSWPDMRTRLLADFSAGTGPDLIEFPAPWSIDFGQQGFLVDITDRIEAWPDSDDWFDATWQEVTHEGRRYGVKLHHTAFGFFYNVDMLERAGLEPRAPSTLQEFRSYAETIADELGPDVLAFGFDADPFYLLPFIATEETPALVADGEIAIDTPNVIEALGILQEIARNDLVLLPEPGASYQSSRRAFIDGRTAMMISGPWDIGTLNDSGIDYGIGAVPVLEGLTSRPPSAGTAVSIGASSEQPDLVWELIQRLTSVETEVAATLEAGMLMPRQGWAQNDEVRTLPKTSDFIPLVERAAPVELEAYQLGLPEIVGTGDVFTQFYQNVIYDRRTPERALQTYIDEATRLIERSNR